MKCHSDVKRSTSLQMQLVREVLSPQRCSLESHCLKVHGVQHSYAYKERRSKVYVCEECGHTTGEPEFHYVHLKENHPYSPALLKFYDKRHFKFQNTNFTNMLLMSQT
ncbi:Protein ovo [Armadillidium vulgare]|nr:Protein ovo [Armadillidium vulgare]